MTSREEGHELTALCGGGGCCAAFSLCWIRYCRTVGGLDGGVGLRMFFDLVVDGRLVEV